MNQKCHMCMYHDVMGINTTESILHLDKSQEGFRQGKNWGLKGEGTFKGITMGSHLRCQGYGKNIPLSRATTEPLEA